MLGLLALGLTSVMIYTLIKNALSGKQLSKDDVYQGTIEMIIPVGASSDFHLNGWRKSISSFQLLGTQLKIHVLIDGHHSSLHSWQELQSQVPFLEIHTFTMRPSHVEGVSWMLDQFMPKVSSGVIIIGDSELVPTGAAFLSVAKNVKEKNRSYFIVPQTAQLSALGEAISVLNPTLAFVSFFGFRKWRKNLSHPLLSISQGWMAMPVEIFRALDFKAVRFSSWKETITRQWDEQGKDYFLAFGEKQLVRYYSEDLKTLAYKLKDQWAHLWHKRSSNAFFLYVSAVVIWSFPIICFVTHPFWSIASIFLLVLYRFFSKIVFQETWRAVLLHPFGCLFLITTFIWWLTGNLKSKGEFQAPV